MLRRQFGDCFKNPFVTMHPRGVAGEIPGKCSNINYAMRTTLEDLKEKDASLKGAAMLVTTADCDTIFGERYFDALEEDYFSLEEKVFCK